MPQVAPGIAKARAARLREAGAAAFMRHLDTQSGRRITALVERGGKGRAEDFTPVHLQGFEPGTLVDGEVIGHHAAALMLRRSS
jgi:threonylcarbamoyladenosine tRNA methylthiotransferase MtaB